jgi:hypothetical protein
MHGEPAGTDTLNRQGFDCVPGDTLGFGYEPLRHFFGSIQANLILCLYGCYRARGVLVWFTLVRVNPPTRPGSSLTRWFTDLRSIALIACVTGVLSLPLPIWNALQTTIVTGSPSGFWKFAGIPVVVSLTLFTAIMPVFYIALYLNETVLHFPKRLRLLALVAATTFGAIVLTALAAWVRSIAAYFSAMKTFDWSTGATSVLAFARDPRTIGAVSTLLAELSNIACILMLIAIFRWADEPLYNVPISRMLRVMTKVAVISWGLVVAFLVLRVIAMPYVFFQLRAYAFQIGRTPPRLWVMMAEAIRTLLIQACLFATPYIVYRSQRERIGSLVDLKTGPETIEGSG